MNTRIKLSKVTLTAFFAVAVAACDSGEGPSPQEPAVGATSQGATVAASLTFDTRAIDTHPAAALPGKPLPLAAFNLANVERSLARVDESFTTTQRVSTRSSFDSRSWHTEIDPAHGQALTVSQLAPGAATPQKDDSLRVLAEQRMVAFGITGEEVFGVAQRRSMMHDEDNGTYGTPEIDGYKTFAFRGINGVRIRGHRTVVTFGPDGAFRRALVKWPALAASGHQLRSPLSSPDIVARATRALAAGGITSGAVTMEWLYVPVEQKTGEVTLTLKAVAKVPYDAALGEARHVEVDVDAS